MRRRTNKYKVVAAALALTVFMSFGAVSASAAKLSVNSTGSTSVSVDAVGREHKSLKALTNKNLSAYTRNRVSVGGVTLAVQGFNFGGVSYIPFRAAASAVSGSTYSYNSGAGSSTMRAPGLEITAGNGCYVSYANGRALFSTAPTVIMSDGRMYIPATVFAKAVGMTLDVSGSSVTLSGSFKPLTPADKFYRADEVLWLARIIHAESKGEPLLGQIAVGNVVLNRVKSAYYPNTIYGVIFDRKYGVQFSPVLDGSIYNTPSYNSTLAAKICLEGYDVSDGAFFFLNTRFATSSWIPRTREYAFTIGNHDFYK